MNENELLGCPFCGNFPVEAYQMSSGMSVKCAELSCPNWNNLIMARKWNARTAPKSTEAVASSDIDKTIVHAFEAGLITGHNQTVEGSFSADTHSAAVEGSVEIIKALKAAKSTEAEGDRERLKACRLHLGNMLDETITTYRGEWPRHLFCKECNVQSPNHKENCKIGQSILFWETLDAAIANENGK